MTALSIAAVQHDIVWENPDANFERLGPTIRRAVEDGARIVALTEMFSTGFSVDSARIAEPPGGPAHEFLREMAAGHDVWVGGSIATDVGSGLPRNRFLMTAPDGTSRHYDKIHPFGYGGESAHYGAGTSLETWDIEGVRVTPFVCYDLRFADEFWQRANDTDCYLVVANWPARRREHWRALLPARAIENLAYVVGVNRVGAGGGLDYVGDSVVIDPIGSATRAADGIADVLMGTVDTDVVRKHRDRFGFLADRR